MQLLTIVCTIPGVAKVAPHGLAELTVIVRPDLDRLAAANLTMVDVLAALRTSEASKVTILEDITLAQVEGAPITLRDVATIEHGFERAPDAPAPALAIHSQPTATKSTVLAAVRDAITTLERPPGMQVTELAAPAPARSPPPLIATLTGPSHAELQTLADGYTAQLAALGVTDIVRDPLAQGEREQTVRPDRERAAALGIPLADIVATLAATRGDRVGNVAVDGAPQPINIKLAAGPRPLDKLFVRSTRAGALVPLSDLVTVEEGRVHALARRNGEPTLSLSISASRPSLAAARKALQDGPRPPRYRITLAP